TVDVRFARTEVAALHGVVKEAVDAVAIVVIVLGGVDAALRGDGVGAAGRILKAEGLDVVAELGERSRSRSAGEAGADNDDRMLALVGRVDELERETMAVPARFDRTGWALRV